MMCLFKCPQQILWKKESQVRIYLGAPVTVEEGAFTLKGLSLKPLNDQHLIPPYSSVYENKGNTCQSQKLDCSMNSPFQY